MVDDMLDRLQALPKVPAWQYVPEVTERAILDEPVPYQGQGEERAYADFVKHVMPYPNGCLHPRFFGWVQGNGTPLGMMADMLAAGLNAHMAGSHHSPRFVEEQTLKWLAELMGFPPESSGVFESGGSMANVLGLAVARHAKAGWNVRALGLQSARRPMVIYCSTEVHGWAQKAVELLGLGDQCLHRIPVDARYRMELGALQEAIVQDQAAGLHPICVIGTAGTVNTGATDDLRGIAAICRAHDLWFHVDGAFGALVRLSPALRAMVNGIEEADSLAFDLHKWGSQPIECAVTLVRDAAMHKAAFALSPSYLAPSTRGVVKGGLPFADRGMDLTRGFKALKVWMSFKAHGIDQFARVIEQNVRDTAALARRVEQHPELELMAPADMNIVCLRYRPRGMAEQEPNALNALNALNMELLLRIQESGIAVPSATVLQGRYAIRVANTNHRSKPEDFDMLFEAFVRLGREIAHTPVLAAEV
jgi:aromatic-L-amino-acid decarboxylase